MESINCLTDCPAMGMCCRVFYLHGPRDKDELLQQIETETPFTVVDALPDELQCICTCSQLGADGLCRDYENRPEICRNFQPGAENLCVLYCGPPTPQSLAVKYPQYAARRWQPA